MNWSLIEKAVLPAHPASDIMTSYLEYNGKDHLELCYMRKQTSLNFSSPSATN